MKLFDPGKFTAEAIEKLKTDIDDNAIIACSGGVDSIAATVLVNRAVGKKLLAVHVDTGFMRKNESQEVVKMMDNMGINYSFIDASQEFYDAH